MQANAPTVRQFMTPNPVIIDGGLSIADAFTRMFQIHARHLPVYTQGHLVGILSDRDIGHLSAVQGVDPNKTTAEQACSPNPYTCQPDTPIAEVAAVMAEHRFGAALVMEDGALVGMFTVVDALQALVAVLRRDETQSADPNHAWSLSAADPNKAPGVDIDTRQGTKMPNKTPDTNDRPDLDKTRERSDDTDTSNPDIVHANDPARDGLQSIEDNRTAISTPPPLSGNGIAQGIVKTGDLHSDAGNRSAMRRAAATVHRNGT